MNTKLPHEDPWKGSDSGLIALSCTWTVLAQSGGPAPDPLPLFPPAQESLDSCTRRNFDRTRPCLWSSNGASAGGAGWRPSFASRLEDPPEGTTG